MLHERWKVYQYCTKNTELIKEIKEISSKRYKTPPYKNKMMSVSIIQEWGDFYRFKVLNTYKDRILEGEDYLFFLDDDECFNTSHKDVFIVGEYSHYI